MDTTQIIQIAEKAASNPAVNVYLLALMAILGAVYHFNKKIGRLRNQAGHQFIFSEYLNKEATTIVSSVIVIIVALVCQDNIKELQVAGYVLGKWMYPTFFGIGYLGDSFADKIFGGYEKAMRKAGKIK